MLLLHIRIDNIIIIVINWHNVIQWTLTHFACTASSFLAPSPSHSYLTCRHAQGSHIHPTLSLSFLLLSQLSFAVSGCIWSCSVSLIWTGLASNTFLLYTSVREYMGGGGRGLCYAVSDSNHAGVEAAVIVCIRDASQAISSTVDMVKPGEPRGQGAKGPSVWQRMEGARSKPRSN